MSALQKAIGELRADSLKVQWAIQMRFRSSGPHVFRSSSPQVLRSSGPQVSSEKEKRTLRAETISLSGPLRPEQAKALQMGKSDVHSEQMSEEIDSFVDSVQM